MINIDVNSPVVVVTAEVTALAGVSLTTSLLLTVSQKIVKRFGTGFFADAGRDPRDISIPGAYLEYCYPVQRLTPRKRCSSTERPTTSRLRSSSG